MSQKSYILFLFFCFSGLFSSAQLNGVKQEDVMQEDNVFLNGLTSDYYTGDAISGINITAVVDGKTIASGTSDGKGEYKLVLEYDKEYIITFSKSGFITKKIVMNTFGVPDKRKQKVPDMVAEITMVQPNNCIKAELLDKPIGRAKYFTNKNVIDWDMDYSAPLLSALNQMLDKCEEEAEKEKEAELQREKDCANAMKDANKAFAKKDWNDSKAGYEKALTICPEKTEAQERLKLIDTELTKKAEVEKQREEEKARAEAEAIAKAEAEAAAKKAEEEKIAKEKAEKEMLAKAEAEAKELAKAEAAAKKAETERIAKEQKEKEALAKQEAELKTKLEKEATVNKLAEEKAKEEEKQAIANAKEEEKGKLIAQAEAKKRAEQEAKALAEQNAAKKREEEERQAKEIAASLAVKAETERAANEVFLVKANVDVKIEIAQQEEAEKKAAALTPTTETKETPKFNGSSAIKIKNNNKGRHLYEKPNKPNKGKGPELKKRMVF
jgi:hypothetical protein